MADADDAAAPEPQVSAPTFNNLRARQTAPTFNNLKAQQAAPTFNKFRDQGQKLTASREAVVPNQPTKVGQALDTVGKAAGNFVSEWGDIAGAGLKATSGQMQQAGRDIAAASRDEGSIGPGINRIVDTGKAVLEAITAPLAGVGGAAQRYTEKTTKALGASPDVQRAAGEAAGQAAQLAVPVGELGVAARGAKAVEGAGETLESLRDTGEGTPFAEGRKLNEGLNQLTQRHYKRGIEAVQALEAAPKNIPISTWEKIYHWEETPDRVTLTPEEHAIWEQHVKPLADLHNKLYEEASKLGLTKQDLEDLTPGKIGELGYTPRFAKKKDSLIARLVEQEKQSLGGKTLSTRAGSLRARSQTLPTAEIERQSGEDMYYKHVLVNRAAAVTELERAVENAKFLQQRLPDLEAKGMLAKAEGGHTPPGWTKTQMPTMRGYVMERSVAHALDDFWGAFHKNHTPLGEVMSRANNIVGGIIFMLPVRHIINIANTWAAAKGVSSLVSPGAYARLPRTFARAVDEVRTQGPIYREILEHGGALQTARDGMANLHKVMLKKIGAEIEANPTVFNRMAKALGYADPRAWARRVIAGSEDHEVLWSAGDMMYVQNVLSLMERGRSMPQAIAETEKWIPNYRIPSQVYKGPGGRVLAQIYKDPNVTFFGRYRGSLLGSYYGAARDVLKPLKPGDRAKALDRLGMLGLMGLVGYPILDQAVQTMTGNKNAQFVRSGLSALPSDIGMWSRGEKGMSDVLSSLITPAPGYSEPLQLIFNHDLFTGQQIYDPHNPLAAAGQIGTREIGQSGVGKAGQRIFEGKTDLRRVLEQQFGITDPTPEQLQKARQFQMRERKKWQKTEGRNLQRVERLLP